MSVTAKTSVLTLKTLLQHWYITYPQNTPPSPSHVFLALTWPQNPDFQQVGGPVCQPCPAAVVVLPPELSHTLVLASLCVTCPADAQAHIVAGFSLLDGSAGPETHVPVTPLDPTIACESNQVMKLRAACWLETPCY